MSGPLRSQRKNKNRYAPYNSPLYCENSPSPRNRKNSGENIKFSKNQIRHLVLYCIAIGELGNEKYNIRKSSLRNLLRKLQKDDKTKTIFETADPSVLGQALKRFNYLEIGSKDSTMVLGTDYYYIKYYVLNLLSDEEKSFLESHSLGVKNWNTIFMMTKKVKDELTVVCVCEATVTLLEFINHLTNEHYDDLGHQTQYSKENDVNDSCKLNVSIQFVAKTSNTVLKIGKVENVEIEVISVWICRGKFVYEIDKRQLQSVTKKIKSLFLGFPLLQTRLLSFPFNRMVLDSPNETYLIVILFKHINSPDKNLNLEIHSLKIEESIITILNKNREFIRSRVLLSKTNSLPPHLSDRKLYKYFDDKTFKMRKISSNIENEKLTILESFIKDGCRLTQLNYVKVLMLLNEIEDLFITKELEEFTLKNKKIYTSFNSKTFLKNTTNDRVPKLLSDNDTIYLHKSNGQTFEGKITKIFDKKIEFESKLLSAIVDIKKFIECSLFKITFRKERSLFAIEQQALKNLSSNIIARVLFPELENTTVSPDNNYFDEFSWASNNISNNKEQQEAVKKIVNGTAHPAPFFLFGPPGTGKTTTLVEAITQILKLQPQARIFVTASSNYAVDEISKRILCHVPELDCFRYYAGSMNHKKHQLNKKLVNISNLRDKLRSTISVEELMSFRVVLSTLTGSGWLFLNEMPKNSFDYIFIDECASCTEATAIIPISGLVSMDGLDFENKKVNIIIAGDPKQLGSVVQCREVEKHGLGRSMMERLMNHPVYDVHSPSFRPEAYTKLVQNFRSHQSILHVPNKLFYDNELIPNAPTSMVNWALNWRCLPNKQYPIIFDNTIGDEETYESSTSYYNRRELEKINKYIKKILREPINGKVLTQKDIGIVTPYQEQRSKIERNLNRSGWKDIEVGTVEQFQGQERMVIIISTVRTTSIGFLDNPKRMNVAITRAQGLLIVVGNKRILRKDQNWKYFVEYCVENKLVTGDISL